jgi:O-methyltransferase / aklanonic acid methyltransferase
VHETKSLISGLFGRVAASYDQAGFLSQIARRLVVHANVQPGMRVLDACCGTGAAMGEAARRVGEAGIVLGIDLSASMAAQAARKARSLGPGHGSAAVAAMDAEQLGLRPGSFDVVGVASAVYLLTNQVTALRALRELLRPDGLLAVSDFTDLDERWGRKDLLLRRFAPPA